MRNRDYDFESERQKGVEEFYRTQHINQTYDFVSKLPSGYHHFYSNNNHIIPFWKFSDMEILDIVHLHVKNDHPVSVCSIFLVQIELARVFSYICIYIYIGKEDERRVRTTE